MKPPRRRRRNTPQVGSMPTTPSVFDPTSNYGRDKETPYLNTSLGHHDINNDHQGYYRYLLGRSGLDTATGAQPFHQWLKTTGFQRFEDGYNAARLQNPKLSYAHYMQTTGVPGDANAFNLTNTTPAAATVKRRRGRGRGKANPFEQFAGGAENSAKNLSPWVAEQRNAYRKLTPEQSGEYMSSYTMGPARWSVFG